MKLFHTITRLSILGLLLSAPQAQAFDPCTDASHYAPLKQRYKLGLLFKVEKCKAPVSYIFGTMHLARPQVTQAAASAFLTLYNVQAAGFELAEDESAIGSTLLKSAVVPPGDKYHLSRELGNDYFDKLVGELGFMTLMKGYIIQTERVDRFRPWAVATLMEVIGEDKGSVLDEKIRAEAIKAGKPIFGLETMDEQKDALSSLPNSIQVRMLKDAIDHYPDMLRDKEELVKAYVAKDGRKIQSLEEKEVTSNNDRELQDILYDRLLVKRNRVMVQRLLPRLEKQSLLVSVGVMHLLGEDGILRQLEQHGYFITPMP